MYQDETGDETMRMDCAKPDTSNPDDTSIILRATLGTHVTSILNVLTHQMFRSS